MYCCAITVQAPAELITAAFSTELRRRHFNRTVLKHEAVSAYLQLELGSTLQQQAGWMGSMAVLMHHLGKHSLCSMEAPASTTTQVHAVD